MNALPPHIRDILHAAVAAPSGDNSQPWHFVFKEPNHIEIHAHPERDNELLNVNMSGTLISVGAAYENALLKAKSLGYDVTSVLSDDGMVLYIDLLKTTSSISERERALSEAIPHRHSNRHHYDKKPLESEDKRILKEAALGDETIVCTLIEDRTLIDAVSRDLTVMEEVALSNQKLHELFFKGIFWSKIQNAEGKPGLYIKTLALPGPAEVLFLGLRNWNVARILQNIQFSQKVAETNAKQNASTSAYIFINVKELNYKNYIEAGRALERIWLTVTERGMSCQMVSGMLFLARRLEMNNVEEVVSVSHKKMVRGAYANVRAASHPTYHPLLALRVGYSKKARARSARKAPVVVRT